MDKEIAIVSAFFNIKRDNWDKFARTEDLYFEYFTGWAKLKNKLVVFVETERMKNMILDFRRGLGLEDLTVVEIVDDFRDIDPELYESIKKATENPVQKGARLFPKNPEVWNADYNYVMLLKMWCVKEAIKRGHVSGMVAWMDFGYNHGGAILDKNSDFGFTWKYDFPDKINLFLVQELDERPIFDIVCSMDTYIMGTVIIGIDYYWDEFWHLMRNAMISLNDSGLTDDDQNIILMSYRKKPEIFELHLSDWQMPLKQFGGDHIELAPKRKEPSIKKLLRTCYHYYVKLRRDMALSKKIYKYLREHNVH